MFKNRLNLKNLATIVACFAVVLMFADCDNDIKNNPPNEEPNEWNVEQSVYVAGFETVGNNPVARLWKNGELQNLSGSIIKSTETISSEARSVYVAGDDVYVAGYDLILEEGEYVSRARLWKNGEVQELDSGVLSDEAIAVFVTGNDVYILGCEKLEPSTFWGNSAFKYWKNGKVTIFAEGHYDYWRANSIFVSNDDVYIAGFGTKWTGSDNVTEAKLWKNGIEEDYFKESSNSRANSVFVAGNDIYVAGYDLCETSCGVGCVQTIYVAKLWINGVKQDIASENEYSSAESVFVSGENVYVAGHENKKTEKTGNMVWVAKLWKNGIAEVLYEGEGQSIATSVFVLDGDEFVAGYVTTTEEVEPGSTRVPVTYFQSAIWKNGKILKLNTSGKYINSKAFSVFVK